MTAPTLIRDPKAIPVVARDDHLPAVPGDRLTRLELKRRLDDPPPWQPEFRGDGLRLNPREPRAAAVLVALVERPAGLQVLLTRRTDHLRDHAGQISFAGGRQEAHDADLVATALREAREEIGLHQRHVRVLGHLPTYNTISAYVVTPVVALVEPPFDLTLDPDEVAEAFEVPLAFLMDPAHHQRHRFEAGAATRHFLSMPWQGADAKGRPREYFIWGATAAMLRNLYRLLVA